jgi:hypothetical protein
MSSQSIYCVLAFLSGGVRADDNTYSNLIRSNFPSARITWGIGGPGGADQATLVANVSEYNDEICYGSGFPCRDTPSLSSTLPSTFASFQSALGYTPQSAMAYDFSASQSPQPISHKLKD